MNRVEIESYHAHVYYDAATLETARQVCEAARERFPGLEMGRMHERLVGPHPRWSCQLAFPAALFAEVLPWLMVNREGLTVFTHPNSGDALGDHRERALWMGELLDLDLSIFEKS